MYPILLEIGPLPTWAAGVMVIAFGLAALALEAVDQRRAGNWPHITRLSVITMGGGLLGFGVWYALNRWGPLPVRAWGTLLMLGFLAGMLWALYDSRDDPAVDLDVMIDLTLVILVGAVIGARVLSVVLQWQQYAADTISVLEVWNGGMSFHGGLIGGTLAGVLYLRSRGLNVLKMIDLLTPSVTLGYAITRVGCFLNGCCYGAPTNLPWGVRFPVHHHEVPHHPTQLYSAAAGVLIFGLLLAIRRRLRRPGHLMLVYLIAYSVARIIIEEFRRGASAEVFAPLAPLTVAQVASIAIGLLAAIVMVVDLRRARQVPSSSTESSASAGQEGHR